jgi:hypothetical protein
MNKRLQKIYQWWQKNLQINFWWWAVGIVVIILGLGGWFLLKPLYTDLRTSTQVDSLKDRIVETQNRLVILKRQAKTWEELQQGEQENINLVLPSVNDLPNLIVQLEALAKQTKFNLQGIAISEKGELNKTTNTRSGSVASTIAKGLPSGVRTLKITITLEGGDYTRLKEFLQATQSAWRLLDVNSLSFARDGSYAVELSAYYYPY